MNTRKYRRGLAKLLPEWSWNIDLRKPLTSFNPTWINVDGIKKSEVEKLCNYYGIHHLLVEDILSSGQRAKMDDSEKCDFCLAAYVILQS